MIIAIQKRIGNTNTKTKTNTKTMTKTKTQREQLNHYQCAIFSESGRLKHSKSDGGYLPLVNLATSITFGTYGTSPSTMALRALPPHLRHFWHPPPSTSSILLTCPQAPICAQAELISGPWNNNYRSYSTSIDTAGPLLGADYKLTCSFTLLGVLVALVALCIPTSLTESYSPI